MYMEQFKIASELQSVNNTLHVSAEDLCWNLQAVRKNVTVTSICFKVQKAIEFFSTWIVALSTTTVALSDTEGDVEMEGGGGILASFAKLQW